MILTLENSVKRICLALLLAAGTVGAAEHDIAKLSAKVDSVINAKLSELTLDARPEIDDYAFARRVHLDLIGRIPTLAELRAFTSDSSPSKRRDLISKLLKSKGYNSHMTNYWMDLLRVLPAPDRLHHAGNFSQAIKTAVRENRPYDDFVRDIVNAKGPLYEKGNGLAGFKARESMQLDRLANTTKTFLGMGIDCAQCHDHPFDDWTQKDFYQLAAFTSNTKLRVEPPAQLEKEKFGKIRARLKKEDFDKWIVYRESLRYRYAAIYGDGTGFMRLPHDYKYDDGNPHDVMEARTLFGKTPTIKTTLKKEQVQKAKKKNNLGPMVNAQGELANWIASPDNEMFTKATVNRLWNWVMGVELVGALGGLTLDDNGPHPELTAAMIGVMKAVDYDTRAFFEVLLNTRAYQSKALASKTDRAYYLDGPVVRRMSAEMVWDSILSLRHADPDKYVPTRFEYDGATHFHEKAEKWTEKDFDNYASNSGLSRGGFYQAMTKEAKARERQQGPNHHRRASEAFYVAAGKNDAYKEVGELFGASTRELIDGANTDPNIPQVLYLMNGPSETSLLFGGSLLNKRMKAAKTPHAKHGVLWQAILSRPMRADEKAIAAGAGKRLTSYQDLAWALLNSNEFRFQR
jgi:hypothetical protein